MNAFAFVFEDEFKAGNFEVACINLGMDTSRSTRYPYGEQKDDVVIVYADETKHLTLKSMAELIEDRYEA